MLNQEKEIDRRTSQKKKKKRRKRKKGNDHRRVFPRPPSRFRGEKKKKKKKFTFAGWEWWYEIMEIRSDLVVARNGAKLARNAAKCFYYSSVWRWPKANRRDKSKRLRCFYKLHTLGARRRRETEPTRSIPVVRLFIQIFLFPSESEGTLIRISDFYLSLRREEYARNAHCFYWISKKLENKKKELL